MKSFYCRSKSVQRAHLPAAKKSKRQISPIEEKTDYEEMPRRPRRYGAAVARYEVACRDQERRRGRRRSPSRSRSTKARAAFRSRVEGRAPFGAREFVVWCALRRARDRSSSGDGRGIQPTCFVPTARVLSAPRAPEHGLAQTIITGNGVHLAPKPEKTLAFQLPRGNHARPHHPTDKGLLPLAPPPARDDEAIIARLQRAGISIFLSNNLFCTAGFQPVCSVRAKHAGWKPAVHARSQFDVPAAPLH